MPARLHTERIARTGTTPASWLLMTHGIFGAGSNWRGIARKINDARPEWGIVLVDLRLHGRSEPGAPPYTLAACAEDLLPVIAEHGITAIAGHSFGGKVVLATRGLAPPGLRQTWVLDASPSARPGAENDPDNSVTRVLALMEELPKAWTSRDDFIHALVRAGQTQSLAQWLAMNLVPDDRGAYVNRLDLASVRALLTDYYAQDLWHVVEDPSLPGVIEYVIAARSSTVSPPDRGRLAAAPDHVHVHTIDAGHWLHIEAANQVVELFVQALV